MVHDLASYKRGFDDPFRTHFDAEARGVVAELFVGCFMTPKTKLTQQKSGEFRMKNSRGKNQVKAEAASPPRIIGGDLKGRRLAFWPGGPTRPMKDRVREMTFDLLGTAVRGATVVDLFAGTGALGFEALSRGAQQAIFAERHFPTADCLRRSSQELGLVDRVDVLLSELSSGHSLFYELLVWPSWILALPRRCH